MMEWPVADTYWPLNAGAVPCPQAPIAWSGPASQLLGPFPGLAGSNCLMGNKEPGVGGGKHGWCQAKAPTPHRGWPMAGRRAGEWAGMANLSVFPPASSLWLPDGEWGTGGGWQCRVGPAVSSQEKWPWLQTRPRDLTRARILFVRSLMKTKGSRIESQCHVI